MISNNEGETERDIVDSIDHSTKVLTYIVLLLLITIFFVNIKILFTVHKLSIIIPLSVSMGLVIAGFYLSRKISLKAINSLMTFSDELESRVMERTAELSKTVKILEENVSERKKAEEKLYNMSITDELTGLYNRRGFFTLVEHRLKLAKREKIGLLMLYADLDNLKGVNDTFGHEEGDLLLKETGNILKKTYRETDIVARIGGDEFVVFPVGTNKDHTDIIANRLQKNVESYNANNDNSYKLSISVGIAAYDPESISSIDGLLAHADELMYDHKRSKQKG